MTTLNTVPNIGTALARALVITLAKAYDREVERLWGLYDADRLDIEDLYANTIGGSHGYDADLAKDALRQDYPKIWADSEDEGLLTFNSFVRGLGFNPDNLPIDEVVLERGCC